MYCIMWLQVKKNQYPFDSKYIRAANALRYTTIVAATASIVPHYNFQLLIRLRNGEYFRDLGKSALIIYDDLLNMLLHIAKCPYYYDDHQVRSLSGDIFYIIHDYQNVLQNKFKFRRGQLNCITIVETQAGDVSGYILQIYQYN